MDEVGALAKNTGTTLAKANLNITAKIILFKPTDLNAGYYVKSSEDGLSEEGIKQARFLPEKYFGNMHGATIGKPV